MKHLVACPLIGVIALACAAQRPYVKPPVACAQGAVFEDRAPGVSDALNSASAWSQGNGDEQVALGAQEIDALNEMNRDRERAAYQDVIENRVANPERIQQELSEREQWLRAKLDSGEYREDNAGDFDRAMRRVDQSKELNALHIAASEMDIRCVPMAAGLFTSPRDEAFDRNRCSRLHLGEVVRVLRRSDSGRWLYVHAGHSVGWLEQAQLTPEVTEEQARDFTSGGRRAVVIDDFKLGDKTLRQGRSFPLRTINADGAWVLSVPTPAGLVPTEVTMRSALHEGFMPFTRRNVLRLAFARLDEPYGWGGYKGGRDCSRFLLDLFAVFGIKLGRHSKVQGRSGSTTAQVGEWSHERKRQTMASWSEHGVVFAYMPGHIMLYLGERHGRPFALSAISEYLRPCRDGHEVVRLDRVVVTDFTLGAGTERSDYLSRLTSLTVFGAIP